MGRIAAWKGGITIIIFDLDGTLYRTHETCLPPLYELCKENNISLGEEDERFLLYTTAPALLDRVAPNMTRAAIIINHPGKSPAL
jgi:phosphoglycolate phosphatase-like HAD superfamily hydrolase